jgi:hypothetical protein
MNIETIKKKSFGISIIVFPIMLLMGFIMHPNILKFEALQTVEQQVGRFHNQPLFHIGHFIVMFTVPVIMIALVGFMDILKGEGKRLGFWGGIIALFGSFILAVDKGALCLVLSAFDTLPEAQFQNFIPYLDVIVHKAGLLWVVWFLPLLPLGTIIQALGLRKERYISKWQTVCIISGLLLLNNPDIELISSIGAIFMCAGFIPWGVRILQGRLRCNSTSCPKFQSKQVVCNNCPKQ